MNALLPMSYLHLDSILVVDMLSKMLGGVNRAVLTAGAPETEHQRRESALDVPFHMMVGKLINGL